MSWIGDERFEGDVAPAEGEMPSHAPRIRIDGNGEAGPSPVIQLLLASAACAGIDVVLILQKMRVELVRCDVEVSGLRREDAPRRFLDLHLTFLLSGGGLDETKARRAIELSVTKYCSVLSTLDPDMPVTWDCSLV